MDNDKIKALIADDSFAMSFQSMGQYRTALLRALKENETEPQRLTMKVKVDAGDAIKAIPGMEMLVTAAATFCMLVEKGEVRSVRNYNRFKAALKQMGVEVSEQADLTIKPIEHGQFYHMNGTPAAFDIDEDLGHLILAVQRGLQFICNGPGVAVSERIADEMYLTRVAPLLPRVDVLVESRISVQYPYSKLVDLTFIERNDLHPRGGGYGQLDRLRCSVQRLSDPARELQCIIGDYRPGSAEALPATKIIQQVAAMFEHLQQIMVLFGWTIDDVRLTSRQRMATMQAKG